MSTAAKGYRYHRCGPISSVLKLENFTANIANADKDVVLKVTHAPIHRTDAAVINGTALGRQALTQSSIAPSCNTTAFPRVGGYEGLATVVNAGRSKRVKAGDAVWISPSAGVGAWASHVVANGEHVHVLPSGLAAPQLSLAACATNLITGQRLMSREYSRIGKDSVVLLNGGSSLTALVATATAAKQGATVIAAAAPGPRFAAAKARLTAAGAAAVVEYNPAGAKAAKAAAGSKRIALFANGVGGMYFNDFARLVHGTCITYGAQHSFGLMWSGGHQIFNDMEHIGFFAPKYLAKLSYEERQAVFEAAIANAGLNYPVEAVKSLDALTSSAWDATVLEGGKKHVFVL